MRTEPAPGGGRPLPLRRVIPILCRFVLTRIELSLFGLHRLLTRVTRHTLKLGNAPDGGAESPGGNRSVPAAGPAGARSTAALVRGVADRYAPRRINCLVESVVLARALHRQGIAAELKLGVRTITGRLQSHAWVEYDGEPLNDEAGIERIFDAFDLTRATRPSPPDGLS